MATGRLELAALGPFSLAQSIAFARGFAPVFPAAAGGETLRLTFVDDGGEPAAIAVREEGDGLRCDYASALPAEAVRAHAARILSLDVDARPFAELARREPVVSDLAAHFPGRRPVCFGSPWEAACWSVLSQRVAMRQAARVKAALTDAFGEPVEIDGETLRAFPAPARLLALDELTGVWPAKVARLRSLAAAALEGRLDPAALRAGDVEDTLRALERLPGLGPFSAALVLARGAGHPDVAPMHERRIRAAVADAYGIPPPELTDERLAAVADAWRPFRSWVSFLLRNRYDPSAPPGPPPSASTKRRT
jgi:DNA-3-methyladenine glycosylase II